MAKTLKRLLAAVLAIAICAGIALPVFATEPATTSIGSSSINKVAGKLENDLVDVTLSVPGEEVDLSSDIVMIIGRGPSSDYDYLIQTIKKMLVAVDGTPTQIKLGLVTFADTTEQETVLPLTVMKETDPNNEAEDDMDYIIAQACQRTYTNYSGVNLESALITARDMLAADTDVPAERKHMIVVSTGLTYYFDDDNGQAATILGSNGYGNYMHGYKYWLKARNNSTNTQSGYKIPTWAEVKKDGKVDYQASWNNYWKMIVGWIAADQDAYVYDLNGQTYSELFTQDGVLYGKNYTEYPSSIGSNSGKRYGHALTDAEDIAAVTNVVPYFAGAADPAKNANAAHALNYERAQYEAMVVYRQMETPIGETFETVLKDKDGKNIVVEGLGFNCYAIANGAPNHESGIDMWLESNQIGYNFMRMLGGENCVNWKDHADFFKPIENKILYTCAADSYVEDYIGYNRPDKGNFEFVQDPATITMVRGGVTYTTTQIDTKEGATASYKFSTEGEEDFFLDYYYGNGKDTEKFIWTFGDYVSIEKRTSLTYKLKLTEKAEEAGTYTVDTNLSATLYPIDSNGKEGTPVLFPVPSVTYDVVPYDVDIVLALGAGIAQYDEDHAKGYTHTYDSIVNLVEPLVNQGINVKLGLVAVEHYDDVAMPLTVLTKDNYKAVITEGLNTIQKMPAGPTNLHSNIEAAYDMLEADKTVPDANKFFYVFATGRTYNFDNEKGVPTTIINKVSVKGNTYYYWGHYLWQSQRGGHTSLYMIPDRYNNDFSAYWADVCKWVAADGDTYAYSFTDAYDVNDPQWFNTFYNANNKDLKALKIASSRFGWALTGLTNSGLAAIGSGSNPQNALNYERAQYEAYQTYVEMADKYNCYALCTESPSYLNESLYITLGAGYKGTSNIQLGHSFMDHLAQVDGQEKSTVLFKYVFDANNNPITTDFTTDNYFEGMQIDVSKLVKTEKAPAKGPMMMMSPAPKQPIKVTNTLQDVEVAIGEKFRITVEAEGEGLTYQWYYRNKGGKEFAPSSFKGNAYAMTMAEYVHLREVYCVITDAKGNTYTTETVTITRPAMELAITKQPQNVVAEIGEKITISVEAQGEGLTYQWYYRNKNGKEFAASSYKSKNYTITMAEYCHLREVYCVVTDKDGNTVTTDIATMARPDMTVKVDGYTSDVNVAAGARAFVTVNATGDGLTYKWFYKNKNGTSFAASSITGKTYAVSMASYCDQREVYCVITDAYGNEVTTETFKLVMAK